MNREAVLLALHRETFHVEPTTPTVAGGGHDSHEAVQADGYTDDELVKLIRASSDKIRRLWNGQTSDYASPSEADLALIGRLVRQTGRRADRTDRLFRLSGLMRPKWDEPNGPGMTYGSRTIARAIAGCTTWWGSEGWIKRRRKSG